MESFRYLVAWSGGADSTLLLDWYAETSSKVQQVVALSVTGHPHLFAEFVKKQNEVQKRYLKHLRRKGYHVQHQRMEMSGTFSFGEPKTDAIAQPLVWLSTIVQVVQDGDRVLMGYIRDDCFWHNRHLFEKAFHSLCRLKGVDVKLEYPLEWEEKVGVLRRLKRGKVPDSCWFSCEKTKNGKPCGKCSKCLEIKRARKTLKLEQTRLAPKVEKKR